MGMVKICIGCRGKGTIKCPVCGGSGGVRKRGIIIRDVGIRDAGLGQSGECQSCQGTGKILCKMCGGVGKLLPDAHRTGR